MPTTPLESYYQSTKNNSPTINGPLSVQTDMDIDMNTSVDFSDTECKSQTNASMNKDDLEVFFNLNSTKKNSNDISKKNYIEISSDEDDKYKNDVLAENIEPAIDNSDDEIPKQFTEEESEFARFLSELKKRDLDSVQQELNTEVQQLNEQRRREKRDADSVSQAMISECQVSLVEFSFQCYYLVIII